MSKEVNLEVTKKIAQLAKLSMKEDELVKMTGELVKILDFVNQLSEVDTSSVEAIVHGTELPTVMRQDEALALTEEETKLIVSCSEQNLYDQYRVPQVLGEA
ncbi:MAG: Asp-tRNA(Asn)/Glu-tRNA(Gln) amidotransferase subunit GatC [Oligoflexia bacterium]|nr:Asp-tRNA(Asn)/Glu-tRNA(Gln) amidotransferase subunit GatC [Oligoflexia bacterium]